MSSSRSSSKASTSSLKDAIARELQDHFEDAQEDDHDEEEKGEMRKSRSSRKSRSRSSRTSSRKSSSSKVSRGSSKSSRRSSRSKSSRSKAVHRNSDESDEEDFRDNVVVEEEEEGDEEEDDKQAQARAQALAQAQALAKAQAEAVKKAEELKKMEDAKKSRVVESGDDTEDSEASDFEKDKDDENEHEDEEKEAFDSDNDDDESVVHAEAVAVAVDEVDSEDEGDVMTAKIDVNGSAKGAMVVNDTDDEDEDDDDVTGADAATSDADIDAKDNAAADDEDEEATEDVKPKKAFQPKAAPKCCHCGKSVYKTEEVMDSTEHIFHKLCLRCKTCKKSLAGRQIVEDEDQVDLSTSQYREVDGELYCERHGQLSRGTLIQGTLSSEAKQQRMDEIDAVDARPSLKERNKVIKEDLKVYIGDSAPVCSHCGGPLDGPGKIVVNGMERYHEICDPAVLSKARAPRFFVKRVEERPVFMLGVDNSKPKSFLFELDASSKKHALRQDNSRDPVILLFHPDEQSHDGLQRTLKRRGSSAMGSDDEDDNDADIDFGSVRFSCILKHGETFSTTDPRGTEHPIAVDTILTGPLIRGGKKVYAHFSASPDPMLTLYNSEKNLELRRKPQLQLVFNGQSDAIRPDPEDKHKFYVKGHRVRSESRLSSRSEEVELVAPSIADQMTWQHALEASLDLMDELETDDSLSANSTRIVFARLFKLQQGVLQQMVLPFLYDFKTCMVTVRTPAQLFLTEYPELSIEEEAHADPLAQLKEDLQEKRHEEELEQARAAKEAAKAEKKMKKAERRASAREAERKRQEERDDSDGVGEGQEEEGEDEQVDKGVRAKDLKPSSSTVAVKVSQYEAAITAHSGPAVAIEDAPHVGGGSASPPPAQGCCTIS